MFNFFEPLHYFQYNHGFQTWELSPQFAVRSWAYILLHWPLAHLGPKLLGLGKVNQFPIPFSHHVLNNLADYDMNLLAPSFLCSQDLSRYHLLVLRSQVFQNCGGDCK